MKKVITLLGVMGLASSLAEKSTAQNLEEEINKPQKAVSLKLSEKFSPSFEYIVLEALFEINNTINTAVGNQLDLSKIYSNGTIEYDLQEKLRLNTRGLNFYIEMFIKKYPPYTTKVQGIIAQALFYLSETRKIFGDHPFQNVIYGRQKEIVNMAINSGYAVPLNFQGLIGKEIHSWENPYLNYNSITDLPRGSNHIPPNFRSK